MNKENTVEFGLRLAFALFFCNGETRKRELFMFVHEFSVM